MSGSFDKNGKLTIEDGRIIDAFGKKKSGKSIMGKLLFSTYPGDKAIVDIAGDDGPMDDDVIEIEGDKNTLPKHWPEYRRKYDDHGHGKPMTLRYAPDAGSPTFLEDMDAFVGMVIAHGKKERARGRIGVCLLVHEVGVLAPAMRTQPHTRRLLMHNRHHATTVIFCGPRPMDIDPLVIGQADIVYIFEIPQQMDRKRIAENIGWPLADLNEAIDGLAQHEYLRYDANQERPESPNADDLRLVHFPPLPPDIVKRVQ